jgi:type IV pilus assembly protein PilN
MIRINLLPYREKEKQENVLRQVVILSSSLLLFVLILLSVYIYFGMSINGIEKQIQEANTRLIVLNKKVGDLEGFKKDKKSVEQKLEVIKTLDRNRLFPVQMLDELSLLVPVKDIWLEEINQVGNNLRIDGMARDNDVVARFMKSLEKASFIQAVDLVRTKEKEVSGWKLQQFSLACVIKKR